VDWIVVDLTGVIREEISPACSPLFVKAARGQLHRLDCYLKCNFFFVIRSDISHKSKVFNARESGRLVGQRLRRWQKCGADPE
jgi:hypothetical protein